MKIRTLIANLLLLLCFAACSSDAVFEERYTISNLIWKKEDTFKFDVDMSDSVSYDLIFTCRHTASITYSQIKTKVTFKNPEGTDHSFDFALRLRDEAGNLLGEALGDVCDTEGKLAEAVYMAMPGKYQITMQLANDESVAGIAEIGLKVVKAAKPDPSKKP